MSNSILSGYGVTIICDAPTSVSLIETEYSHVYTIILFSNILLGWASKHKFLLKPPSDWDKPYTFSWSEYISMKNSKLAFVDNEPTKKNDYVRVGMKLEAVDPIKPDTIRVATVKGFADHWMFLTFDRTSW